MRHTVYTDTSNNTLNIFVNDNGKLFMEIEHPDCAPYSSYIVLGKSDAEHLAKNIAQLLKDYDLSEDE